MGSTYFSGPVYGAYGLLAVAQTVDGGGLSQTDLEFAQFDVPADEDWVVMRAAAYSDVAGTAAATIDIEDDTVSILSSAITLVADDSVDAVIVKTGNEKGALVAAGSVLTVDATTGATTAPDMVVVNIWGFARKLNPGPQDV